MDCILVAEMVCKFLKGARQVSQCTLFVVAGNDDGDGLQVVTGRRQSGLGRNPDRERRQIV